MSRYGTIINDGTGVRFERIMPAPIDVVWSYITDPAKMKSWIAGGSFEPKIGGRVELRWSESEVPGNSGDDMMRGVVTRWDPPHAVSYTWVEVPVKGMPTEIADSFVAFELESRGNETLLRLTHLRAAPKDLAGFAPGWHAHIDVLEQRLRGEKPGDFFEAFRPIESEYATRPV